MGAPFRQLLSMLERLRASALFWPLLALAALLAFNLLFTPGFARIEVREGRLYGSLIDILHNGAGVMLLSIGMTLVIATAGIDLSVGSIMAIAGAVAALLLTEAESGSALAALAGIAAGVLLGTWNGALICAARLQPIVATLVLLVAGRGLALTLTSDQKVRFDSPGFEYLANGAILGLPLPVFVVAGLTILTLLVLRRTVLGVAIQAIGENLSAARLCGLRVHGTRILVYGFSGLCAGLAGIIAAADIGEADVANAGLYLELDAILAVVIGGTSLTGGRPLLVASLVGAMIMQTLTISLQMRGVPTEHTLMIKGLVAIVVCFLQTPRFESLLARMRRRPAGAAGIAS